MNNGCFKPKDYTGKRIGISTVIKKTNKRGNDGSTIWILKCDCGKYFECRAGRFRKKWSIYSCGCSKRANIGRWVSKDLSTYKSHMATAICPTDKRQKDSGYVIWKLRCDCGKIFERSARMLILGYTKSCGCRNFSMPRGRPRIPNSGAHINALYGHCKRGAHSRNIGFKLTKEECKKLFELDCFYCGEKPKLRRQKNLVGTYASNGIDRIDSNKGYFIGNVVPCCSVCNFAKSNKPVDDFKNWIKKAYLHLFS
jgi:hypothetical protein